MYCSKNENADLGTRDPGPTRNIQLCFTAAGAIADNDTGHHAVIRGKLTGSKNLFLQGQDTGAVGQLVVVGVGRGVAALVEELQVAGVDGHGLVGVGAD